ncbi:hypothetical protein N6H14_25055 [Paenibacillus sp. CC-CFT747]|nr:hypothetical protein N6H14_25055 [Paenibacillus sp. CC-CFT747]
MEPKEKKARAHQINKFIQEPPSQETLSASKAAEYPPSLNRIPKQNNPQ